MIQQIMQQNCESVPAAIEVVTNNAMNASSNGLNMVIVVVVVVVVVVVLGVVEVVLETRIQRKGVWSSDKNNGDLPQL